MAAEISNDLTKSVENLLATGDKLIAAKEKLIAAKENKGVIPHGKWASFVASIPLNMNIAKRLMVVARHPILSNRATLRDLPASCEILWELSKLPDDVIEAKIADGTITPAISIRGARELRKVSPRKPGARQPKPKQAQKEVPPQPETHREPEPPQQEAPLMAKEKKQSEPVSTPEPTTPVEEGVHRGKAYVKLQRENRRLTKRVADLEKALGQADKPPPVRGKAADVPVEAHAAAEAAIINGLSSHRPPLKLDKKRLPRLADDVANLVTGMKGLEHMEQACVLQAACAVAKISHTSVADIAWNIACKEGRVSHVAFDIAERAKR
jgi:hypothetical protein